MRKKPISPLLISFLMITTFISAHVNVYAQTDCSGQEGQTVGLFCNEGAYEGYTLFKPLRGVGVYLIDNDGNLLWDWQEPDNYRGVTMLLTEEGDLIRNLCMNPGRFCGGNGELIRIYDWEGKVKWQYYLPGAHHDMVLLKNGNLLLTVTQPDMTESLIEVKPDYKKWLDVDPEILPPGVGGTIEWEWYVRDHVVPTGEDLADYPELFSNASYRTLNALDVDPESDHIVMSFNRNNEIIVIDHDITTKQAAGFKGDIRYRWGNPGNYGETGDEVTAGQHSTKWIKSHECGYQCYDHSLADVGNIIWFNNGYNRVDEITPPVLGNGYDMDDGVFGPESTIWSYDFSTDCNDGGQSSVQRFPNGNTLFACSNDMMFIEVTPEGEMVWKYVHPFATYNPLSPIPVGQEEYLRAWDEEIPAGLNTSLNYNVDRYSIDFQGFVEKEFYDQPNPLVPFD